MEIVPLSSLSFATATDLWNRGFSDYLVPINFSQGDLNERITSFGLSKNQSLIAKVGERPAGILLFGTQEFNGKQLSWVGGISVAPEFRQQGIGANLMRKALEQGKIANSAGLLLEVIVGNRGAEKLYRDLGFTELNRLTVAELALNKLNLTMSPRLKLVPRAVSSQHLAAENPEVPWQCQLLFETEILEIYFKAECLGWLSLTQVSPTKIILKQIHLVNYQKEILLSLLKTLKATYGDVIVSLNNLIKTEEVTKDLIKLGGETKIEQIQLIYNF